MEAIRGKPSVAQYLAETVRTADKKRPWTCLPEIPTAASFCCQQQQKLPPEERLAPNDRNQTTQPWVNKELYLRSHFKLLREDALRPLRDAVSAFCLSPQMFETPKMKTMGIYDNVHIEGYTFSNRGLGARLTFSLRRVGKAVDWKVSKRLLTGSLVVLVPKLNPQTCIPVIVAARPVSGLGKPVPEIHIWFADAYDSQVDSCVEYVMIEDRASFFEAARHTLRSLQKMTQEIFPMHEHIVGLETKVLPPQYLAENSIINLGSSPSMKGVDAVWNWPINSTSTTGFDDSQWAAVQNILTKRLSIVQGPPGTGKTYLSVKSIKLLLDNANSGSRPIVLACQTNHALDQLLTHISVCEPNFVRLGGRSSDPAIQKRTIHQIRLNSVVPYSSQINKVTKKLRKLAGIMRILLAPLRENCYVSEPEIFEKYGILNHAQLESLRRGSNVWTDGEVSEKVMPLKLWLSNKLVQQRKYQPIQHYSQIERPDVDAEEVAETEAEILPKDEEDEGDVLKGSEFHFTNHSIAPAPEKHNVNIAKLLKDKQDLWQVPIPIRGILYNFMLSRLKTMIQSKFRHLAKQYAIAVEQRRAIMMEENGRLISEGARIVGVTTTGLSKYRALLYTLQPKVILIEEAAETLEASCVTACLPSLEHLILIGDHKQLRPQCHLKYLAGAPYFLDVSLFERLVENGIEFRTLNKQRRMVPEIAKILKPIYGDDITDHPDMVVGLKRPQVAGMGKRRLHFFTHESAEDFDEQGSAFNTFEAEMTINFARYLIQNGADPAGIVILTFYNGQKRKLLRLMSSVKSQIQLKNVRVRTVDSFQGEEAGIVLLSLVRSNTAGKIGFLSVHNRVCVALSRAQCGLYMLGNASMLMNATNLWRKIIDLLASQLDAKGRIRGLVRNSLPLRCTPHNKRIVVNVPSQLESSDLGCGQTCTVNLRCGHFCKKLCHPSTVACECIESCDRIQSCSDSLSSSYESSCASIVCNQLTIRTPETEVGLTKGHIYSEGGVEGLLQISNDCPLIALNADELKPAPPDQALIVLLNEACSALPQSMWPNSPHVATMSRTGTVSNVDIAGRFCSLSLLD